MNQIGRRGCHKANQCGAAFSFVGVCLLFLLAMAGCASVPEAPSKDEPLFGTWIDKALVGSQMECKFAYRADGTSVGWGDGRLPDQPNNYEGRFTIVKKWHDGKRNTWYHTVGRSCIIPYMDEKTIKEYGLVEVHADGKVLEGEWSTVDLPSEFGALGNYHYVYHREE